MINKKNIFENLPSKLEEEFFETIIQSDEFKLERIISKGHSSPKDFWYDQDQNEFVLLLKGSAKIEFEKEIISLNEGDHIVIPAHTKHRVEETSKEEKTYWLTLFY